MDRRQVFQTIAGQRAKQTDTVRISKLQAGLDPYIGPWTRAEASHLLRRTLFGPRIDQIREAEQLGMDQTVDRLLEDQTLPAPPVNYDFEEDPEVAIGETWIYKPYTEDNASRGYRRRSMYAWCVGVLTEGLFSIREKMTLFWHNHFAVEKQVVADPIYNYQYITMLRENCLGNFRQLVKDVTIDPAMLRYLDGHDNRVGRPNENYARELLELFSLGKGPIAGPGDYTTYTEDDIIEIARVLTGWRDRGYFSKDPEIPMEVYFQANRHDTGDKQLSHRFNDVVISDNGEDEYKYLIDLIFEKQEVSRFICRKIYRWLVSDDIPSEIETNVIEPMADLLIAEDYEIKPVIAALLRSEHFYAYEVRGAMIKNPLEFMISLNNHFGNQYPDDLYKRYRMWLVMNNRSRQMQMEYLAPPDVAGWSAYYQEPQFYQLWINSVTLQPRMKFASQVATGAFRVNGERLKVDVFAMALSLTNPLDPNDLIIELAEILYPQPLTQAQIDYLKEILIPGLPDYEWTIEYGDYLNNPDDADLAQGVENALKNLLEAMFSLPEFYLM